MNGDLSDRCPESRIKAGGSGEVLEKHCEISEYFEKRSSFEAMDLDSDTKELSLDFASLLDLGSSTGVLKISDMNSHELLESRGEKCNIGAVFYTVGGWGPMRPRGVRMRPFVPGKLQPLLQQVSDLPTLCCCVFFSSLCTSFSVCPFPVPSFHHLINGPIIQIFTRKPPSLPPPLFSSSVRSISLWYRL